MLTRIAFFLTLVAGTALLAPAAASAQPESADCLQAKAALQVALPGLLEFNPNVYPDDEVPVLGDLTQPFVSGLLGDPDLGGGARAEVDAALVLFASVGEECEPVTPPTTTTPPPTTTTAPPPPVDQDPPFENCNEAVAAGRTSIPRSDPDYRDFLDVDGNGIACQPGSELDDPPSFPRTAPETGGFEA